MPWRKQNKDILKFEKKAPWNFGLKFMEYNLGSTSTRLVKY